MQGLVQDILFDNYVREICKSELALAFLIRGFLNYTQLHQGLSQSLVSLTGRSMRTWYMWNSVHRLHCKPVKTNGVTTPKDLYGVMNKGIQVQLTIARKTILNFHSLHLFFLKKGKKKKRSAGLFPLQ